MFGRKLKGAFLATAAAGALVLGLGTGPANAAASSFTDFIFPGFNDFSDDNREFLIDRNYVPGAIYPAPGARGTLDVGDSLRGLLNINTVNNTAANIGGTTPRSEWTAVFQALIVRKVGPIFFFGPDPDFEANIDGGIAGYTGPAWIPGTGAMMVFFEDFSNNAAMDFSDQPPAASPPADPDPGPPPPQNRLNGPCDDGAGSGATGAPTYLCVDRTQLGDARPPTAGFGVLSPAPFATGPAQMDVSSGPYATEQEFIATAGNGTHFWTLGFASPVDPLTGLPTGSGEGWTAEQLLGGDNVLPAFFYTSGAEFAAGNACMSVLVYGPAATSNSIEVERTTPCTVKVGALPLPPLDLGLTDVAMTVRVRGVSNLDTAFEASSDISGAFNVIAVPEPATLTLFGVGLLGLGYVSRRRKKKVVA